MLEASRRRILDTLPDDAVVLDVGGWAKPLPRADWVIDLLPHETRGLYGIEGNAGQAERFSAATWVRRDICDRGPWPFADDQFDFVVCSHTLEDVRDPLWVCSEMARVARAGYVEVPSRLEEQTYGVQGPWVGWGHHHWLCEVDGNRIEFVFKHHILHGRPEMHVPHRAWEAAAPEDRVASLWWEGSFAFGERIFIGEGELDAYLADFAAGHGAGAAGDPPRRRWLRGR